MPILAESTPPLSLSLPDPDPDTIHGVPLVDLLARCRNMADRYYRKQGRWEPYDEYLSAAHMALVECMQTYTPALAPPGGFKSYALFRVEMALRHVRRATAGAWNMPRHVKGRDIVPKYVIESWDYAKLCALRSEHARQDTIVYLYEVLAFLAHQGAAARYLLDTAFDNSVEEVATREGCTKHNIEDHNKRLRRKLRTWSAEVSYATADDLQERDREHVEVGKEQHR